MRALLFTAALAVAAPPAPKDDPALAGTEAFKAGDVFVLCKGIGVRKVGLRSFGRPAESDEKFFVVTVSLLTKEESRKVEYRTWNEPAPLGPAPRLTDNLGNEYKAVSFPFGAEVVGAVKGTARLEPGEPLADLLVFERPARKAEFLILELPGSHVGAKGTLRFRVPAEQFAVRK